MGTLHVTTPPKTSSNLDLSSLSWGPHSCTELQSILYTHKDRRPINQQPGIYRIPCECGKVYIGETGHLFTAMPKEHQTHDIRDKREKSAIIHHAHTNGHRLLWDESKLHTSHQTLSHMYLHHGNLQRQ